MSSKYLYLRPARPPALQLYPRRLYDSHDPATIMEGNRPPALRLFSRRVYDSHDPATIMEGHRPRCPCWNPRHDRHEIFVHVGTEAGAPPPEFHVTLLEEHRPPALRLFSRRLYDSHDPATIMEGHRPRCPCWNPRHHRHEIFVPVSTGCRPSHRSTLSCPDPISLRRRYAAATLSGMSRCESRLR